MRMFLISLSISIGVFTPEPISAWSKSTENFYWELEIKTDSTFRYEHSFELGHTYSEGKWEIRKDTVNLYDCRKPYFILSGRKLRQASCEHRKWVIIETKPLFRQRIREVKRANGETMIIDCSMTLAGCGTMLKVQLPLRYDSDCKRPVLTDSLGPTPIPSRAK
jgi:hypothetical protein